MSEFPSLGGLMGDVRGSKDSSNVRDTRMYKELPSSRL